MNGATYNDVRVERIDGREPGYTDSDRKHDELRAALADADEVRRGSTREQDRRDHDDTDR